MNKAQIKDFLARKNQVLDEATDDVDARLEGLQASRSVEGARSNMALLEEAVAYRDKLRGDVELLRRILL